MKEIFSTLVIDGVFFQIADTGIARVWQSLLKEWQKSDFSGHIVVIDRGNTAPKIDGIAYYSMSLYDYEKKALESEKLQTICDQFKADLFISTYYTTPLSTPSILIVHDMIPEVIGLNLQEHWWKEKYYSILCANRYICVSQNTANDLLKFYPHIDQSLINIIYNGVDKLFNPASKLEILETKENLGIELPYFLLIGSRMSLNGYKNAILFFKALAQWNTPQNFAVVCVGGEPELEEELSILASTVKIHLLRPDDSVLKAIYSGAIALIYPSLYEGFGLPIVEAMACACPVITCRNSSLTEVAGDAAIYVDEYDIAQMIQALEQVYTTEIRQKLIQSGLKQAKKFSWEKMATEITNLCLNTIENQYRQKTINNSSTFLWQELRKEQINVKKITDNQSIQESFYIEEITGLKKIIDNQSIQESFYIEEITGLKKIIDNQSIQELAYIEEIATCRDESVSLKAKLELANSEIEAMKTSKFWKIRSLWFRVKEAIKLFL
ncbi:MAG: glycosyltransferase family 1 protein [Snowella sp.]|nr:glycosyltransferase family 1 protein [Snowella sp.]